MSDDSCHVSSPSDPADMGEGDEYHTLYGVDRTRTTTRIPIHTGSVTVLGKDRVCMYAVRCAMSGPRPSGCGPHGVSEFSSRALHLTRVHRPAGCESR